MNVHKFISHFFTVRKSKFCGGSKLFVLGRSILELFFAAGTISWSAALQTDVERDLADGFSRSNVELNVVVASSNFLTVLSIASQAPVLATLPSRMVERYAPAFGLTVSPVPLKMEVAPVAMVWSARADREPGALWLRSQVQQILGGYAKPGDTVLNGSYRTNPKRKVRTTGSTRPRNGSRA